jgi:hypothetical protein
MVGSFRLNTSSALVSPADADAWDSDVSAIRCTAYVACQSIWAASYMRELLSRGRDLRGRRPPRSAEGHRKSAYSVIPTCASNTSLEVTELYMLT